MGRRGQLAFNIGYLALVIWLTRSMVTDALQSGEPLTTSSGFPLAVMFALQIPTRFLRVWQSIKARNFGVIYNADATVTLREGTAERACAVLRGIGLVAMGGLPLVGFPAPDIPSVLWIFMLVLGCYVTVSQVIKTRAYVTLSPAGIEWNEITPSFVPWEEVSASSAGRLFFFNSLAVFDVKEAGKYSLKGMRKRVCQRFGIMPSRFDIDVESLIGGIESRRKLHSTHSPAS